MKVKISKIKINQRFRRDIGDINALAASIKEVGLLHPIVISEDYELIAGFRRLKACEMLGWTEVPVNMVPLKDLVKGEFHENAVRKDFTPSEIVAIKRALEPKLREEARERKLSTLKRGDKKPSRSADSAYRGETRDIIAKFAGVSHDTLAKAEAIVEAAERDPSAFKPILDRVDAGKVSLNYAYQMVQRKKKELELEKTGVPPLPPAEFDVIYADPPWKYEFSLRGGSDAHYPLMKTDDIGNLPVPAAKNAILFLWATNPKLPDALRVMKSWGFVYKTNMVWVKDRIGTGYYFRGQHELLLVGVKGNFSPPLEENRLPSVLYAPVGKHSEKPEAVYEIIEKMFPNRRYLELFARKKREGWVAWGLDIAKDYVPSYRVKQEDETKIIWIKEASEK